MKPTMLVIGDSFMTRDPDYRGQHWSEMLLEYNVVNLARAGAPFTWITDQLIAGLEHDPDVAVVGLTETHRLVFERQKAEGFSRYSTCHDVHMTPDEELLHKLWSATYPESFKYIDACVQISFIFETLRKRNIPFVWHQMLFARCHDPINQQRLQFIFDDYVDNELTQDIWTHEHVDRPKFHINNREWQVEFANNVRTLLTKLK